MAVIARKMRAKAEITISFMLCNDNNILYGFMIFHSLFYRAFGFEKYDCDPKISNFNYALFGKDRISKIWRFYLTLPCSFLLSIDKNRSLPTCLSHQNLVNTRALKECGFGKHSTFHSLRLTCNLTKLTSGCRCSNAPRPIGAWAE